MKLLFVEGFLLCVAEALVLSLQLQDSTAKLLHKGRDLLGREALRDGLSVMVAIGCFFLGESSV